MLKAARYLGVPPLAFLDWPARWLWIAAAGSRLDAGTAHEPGSLAARLAQRQRGDGVVATPLF